MAGVGQAREPCVHSALHNSVALCCADAGSINDLHNLDGNQEGSSSGLPMGSGW